MKILCPKCKGKGYKFDSSCLFLTVMAPFAMFLDSLADKNSGLTRKKCNKCQGKGEIIYE